MLCFVMVSPGFFFNVKRPWVNVVPSTNYVFNEKVIKNWSILSVLISSYGCTREV